MASESAHNKPWDALWFNARIATMAAEAMDESGFGLMENSAIAVRDGEIIWLGRSNEIPPEQLENCASRLDCRGQLVTPGLVDCHTHLVYAGNRVNEFEMRLNGASYAELAKAGGGIVSTVKATREASEQELYDATERRLASFLDEGVTTIEIKSGYGLELETEAKMLRVARQLGNELQVDIVTSFLGAHAMPPRNAGDSDSYIDEVCNTMLPAIAEQGLADAVDAFCENIAFSRAQVARVFEAAKMHELPIKLHAEQLSDQNGAALAAEMGALSVDHIEFLQAADVKTIKNNGTVAVLLPGAFYFLGETQLPPIAALRQYEVPIAIASDSNPGSSPVASLLLMMSMACTLFKLTPAETLAGVTRNAAKALGLESEVGSLEIGKAANMVLWNLENPAELSYAIGHNPCQTVMYRGQVR